MKYSCEMIQDLLPLYHDQACSPSSKKVVEEHLKECGACQAIMRQLDNHQYDESLQAESQNVVGNFTKKIKRKSMITGIGLGSILIIPVIVCLICNLATGQALDWFFIVLTALLVFASVTVVPLIAETQRFAKAVGSFTVSLLLLLLTCAIYTRGNWFALAAVSVLLGLSVLVLPILLGQIAKTGILSRHKGLIAMTADTVLLFALIGVIGAAGQSLEYWQIALPITGLWAACAWVLFLLIRYVKAPKLVRAGLSVIWSGIFTAFVNDVFWWILTGTVHITIWEANLMHWNTQAVINGNIYLLTLAVCLAVGVGLCAAGVRRRQ